jgi:TetR/AcrR family transcriptional regulator, ethionamide resistance regulator
VSPVRRAEPVDQRRQRRADARSAILHAARDVLERRPWQQVPLEDVTRSAGLSRTVFYRHFEDRRALLLALLEDAGAELADTGRLWQSRASADPVSDVEAAARALTEVYRVHGRMLQAFADAAAEDPAVRSAYEQLGEQLAAAVAEKFAEDAARGTGTVVHIPEVARALVWMNERYLLSLFGQHEAAATADPEAAAAALTEIWAAVAYRRPDTDR